MKLARTAGHFMQVCRRDTEHGTQPSNPVSVCGSSPRPWGTPGLGLCNENGNRFIPTPVGNTSRPRTSCGWWTVHPHARGEHTSLNPLFQNRKTRSSKSTENLLAPFLSWRRAVRRFWMETDQLYTVKVRWHAPVLAQCLEVESGLGLAAPHHHGVAVLQSLLHRPQMCSRTRLS